MAEKKATKTEINNLELWDKVEKTNPNFTKKAKISGRNVTSIAPQYQIKQATIQFGTYGEKWGFKDIELDYSLATAFQLIVFKGTFFFPKGEFEIINSCKMFMDRKKEMIDDDFAKKIETDSLTKALSKLGFNADIFLGKFDDQRYLEEVEKEFAPEPEPPTEFEIALAEMKGATDIKALQTLWKKHHQFQNQPLMTKAKDERKAEITSECDATEVEY